MGKKKKAKRPTKKYTVTATETLTWSAVIEAYDAKDAKATADRYLEKGAYAWKSDGVKMKVREAKPEDYQNG